MTEQGGARPEPTDAEVAAHVAARCADLARLSQRPGFQTVRYLLGLARLEAGKLAEAGALMHLKAYLVDGRVLRGGAANFSASGLKSQDNDRVETDDPVAVAAFRATFEAAWSR